MQREVIFRDDQKIVTPDLNNLSQFSRETFDALVTNAVSSMRYFSGFGVTKSGQAEITIAAGHYWAGGPVFVRSTSTVFNLLTGGSYLPVVTKRKVAIVVYGETITTDVQDRSFVIDDQGNTEPQSVAMERLRYARLALVAGAESPDPQKPTLDVGVIPVGWITLNTSGVIDGSIEIANDYKLPSIESLKQLIAAIELWRAQIGQIVNTLQSELLKVQASIPRDYSGLVADLLLRIDLLEKLARTPASAVKTFIETFDHEDESNLAASGYACRIRGGRLLFPSASPARVKPALLNPLDSRVKTVNNITLPAYSERARIEVLSFDSELSITQHPVTTYESRQLTQRRQVWDYGEWDESLWEHHPIWQAMILAGYNNEYVTANLSAIGNDRRFWGDAATFEIKVPAGESVEFNAERVYRPDVEGAYFSHWRIRRTRQMKWIEEPYWATVATSTNVTGATLIQNFLNVTNGWLTSIDLPFSRVAGTGDVSVELCETLGGRVLFENVIGRATLPVASLNTNGFIKATLNPSYLKGGTEYAIVLRSQGDHWVRISTGDKFPGGTLYYRTNTGSVEPVQNSGDLCMRLNFARFHETRVELQLANLEMAGGIGGARILSAAAVPQGTQLLFETQRSGVWYQISEGEEGAFTGGPANVAFRAVFIGTNDLMPGLDLNQSEVELTRVLTTLVHESAARALAAATTSVQIHCYLDDWNATDHTLTCTLVGTSGAPVSPVATVTDVDPDYPSKVRRRFTFTPTSTSSFAVRLAGTRAANAAPFSIDTRYDFAF